LKSRRRAFRTRIYGLIVLASCVGFLLLRHWFHAAHPVLRDQAITGSTTEPQKIDTNPRHRIPISTNVKYLSYYPHGGFHTQRVALENALTLCRLLDRTLLLPPLWIGRQVPWQSHPLLQQALGNTTKLQLGHCRDQSAEDRTSECEGHDQWSQVSWSWLVDLEMTDVKWVDRWDFRDEWVYLSIDKGGLGLIEGDIYNFHQDTEFHNQITESEPERHPHRPYAEQLSLREIKDLSNPLLHFDSLSGTNRLLLTGSDTRWMRNEIRSSVVISNELILGPAKKIAQLLGAYSGGYLALDARLDGTFEEFAGLNMRAAWWELGRRQGIDEMDLEQAEREVWSRSPAWRVIVSGNSYGPYQPPPERTIDQAMVDARSQRPTPSLSTESTIPCPRLLHSKYSLLPLNTPLFLSHSTTDPQSHAALRLFYSTYPCLFTLKSTIREIVDESTKNGLINELDGYEMSAWVEKWIEWEVASRSRELVSTNGTAWGKWAEEMVQPIAKG
jgi:hypothetical protein